MTQGAAKTATKRDTREGGAGRGLLHREGWWARTLGGRGVLLRPRQSEQRQQPPGHLHGGGPLLFTLGSNQLVGAPPVRVQQLAVDGSDSGRLASLLGAGSGLAAVSSTDQQEQWFRLFGCLGVVLLPQGTHKHPSQSSAKGREHLAHDRH